MPLAVADEVQQLVSADLRRRGEDVVAMLGQRRVAHVANSMEEGERLIPRRAGYSAETKMVDDGSAMHLLDRDAAQLEHLGIAEPRIGHALHLALVQRKPLRVARWLGEELRANALRYLVAGPGVLAHGVLGFADQTRGSQVQHFRFRGGAVLWGPLAGLKLRAERRLRNFERFGGAKKSPAQGRASSGGNR